VVVSNSVKMWLVGHNSPHYRTSISTSVLPHLVNVDVDVVISIYSRRIMLFILLLAIIGLASLLGLLGLLTLGY